MFFTRDAPKAFFKEVDGRSLFYPYGWLWAGYEVDNAARAGLERRIGMLQRLAPFIFIVLMAVGFVIFQHAMMVAGRSGRPLASATDEVFWASLGPMAALAATLLGARIIFMAICVRGLRRSPVRMTRAELYERVVRIPVVPDWFITYSVATGWILIPILSAMVAYALVAGNGTPIATTIVLWVVSAACLTQAVRLRRRRRALLANT